MAKFTVGSLFAGIGGFDLGLERAGMQVKWQVENNPFCVQILEKHWPHVTRYADITTVDWSAVEPVDLVCGGFPCQDLSVAGKRAGINGTRSGLWSEYVRCLRALRPRYVCVENVPGLLNNAAMGRVLGDLAECGYDAEWRCISAADVGAPHLRKRIWIVAYPSQLLGNGGDHNSIFCLEGESFPKSRNRCGANDVAYTNSERCRRAPGESRNVLRNGEPDSTKTKQGRDDEQYGPVWANVPDPDGGRLEASLELRAGRGEPDAGRIRQELADTLQQQCHRWSDGVGRWEREPQEALRDARRNGRQEDGLSIPESLLGRVAHGIPNRVARLKGLGNAVVPQIVEYIGRLILEREM